MTRMKGARFTVVSLGLNGVRFLLVKVLESRMLSRECCFWLICVRLGERDPIPGAFRLNPKP